MNTSLTAHNTSRRPIACIVNGETSVIGRLAGNKPQVYQALEKICEFADKFSATVTLISEESFQQQSTIYISITPRRNHLLGENPERRLLDAIFSDSRPGSPGALIQYQ